MPRSWTRLLAALTTLFVRVLVARSYNFSARIHLSWPLAVHPDRQDGGLQISLNTGKSADMKNTHKQGQVTNVAPGVFSRKVATVGDLHGDPGNAHKVLKMAGVVTEKGKWSGNVDFFMQTGDIIDRR